MKKYIYILLLLFAEFVSAQGYNVTHIGVVGGPNVSALHAVHNPSGRRFSFYAGFVARIPLDGKREKLFFQPQIEYVQAGETGKKTSFSPKKSVYANNYISIPLYLKYYFGKKINTIFIFGGPRVSFLVSAKVKDPNQERYRTDREGKVNPIEFSVSGGLGYSFSRNFEILGRIDAGLTDNYPRLDDSYFDPKAVRINRQVIASIGISYLIPIKSCDCL